MGAIVGDALAQRFSAPVGAFAFDAARNVQLASFGLLIGGTTAHYWCALISGSFWLPYSSAFSSLERGWRMLTGPHSSHLD